MTARYDPPDEQLPEWFGELQAWDVQMAPRGRPVRHRVVSYGGLPDQIIDVWKPVSPALETIVVSIHGGYFAEDYTREVCTPLARALAQQGFEVWNVEYRRADPGVGNFAATTADVVAAVQAAANSRTAPIVVVGHSAGGYLAEWAAAAVPVRTVVVLAGVTDLLDSARSGNDDGAIARWLGGTPDQLPDEYARARLQSRLPSGAHHVLVHGTEDRTVPAAQSLTYAASVAAAGDGVSLVELRSTGHYALIDPRDNAFQTLLGILVDQPSPTNPGPTRR